MESHGTPARISTQEEHWPFKTTFVFCWSRNQVSQYHKLKVKFCNATKGNIKHKH